MATVRIHSRSMQIDFRATGHGVKSVWDLYGRAAGSPLRRLPDEKPDVMMASAMKFVILLVSLALGAVASAQSNHEPVFRDVSAEAGVSAGASRNLG